MELIFLGDSLGILPSYHILQGKLMFPVRVLSLIDERLRRKLKDGFLRA